MTYLLIVLFTTVVWLSKGHYDPSVPFLVAAFLVWVGMTLFERRKRNRGASIFYSSYPWIASLMMAIKPNLVYVSEALKPAYFYFRFFPIVLTGASVKKSKLMELIFPCAILGFYITALYLSPNPHIDVFQSNRLAVEFFKNGSNPYSQIYPDIYGGEFDYHPGFLYWPATLYLQTISQMFFGDIRVILVLFWWMGAFFFPQENERTPALKKIWWLIPFLAFGFEQGWIDPILSGCAAVVLWALKNQKWWFFVLAAGIAAAAKQYGFMIGIFPVLFLFLRGQYWTSVKVKVYTGLFFLFLLSPFLVWGLSEFIAMTIQSHVHALARPDALNFTAFWMKMNGTDFPPVLQLGFTVLGFALAFFHLLKNHARGFVVIPEAWTMAFGFSIIFGKFAFCNYYWLLISFLLLALAFEGGDKARI